MKLFTKLCATTCLGIGIAAVQPAHAASIGIVQTATGFTFTGGQFDDGISVNGTLLESGNRASNSVNIANGTPINFSGSWEDALHLPATPLTDTGNTIFFLPTAGSTNPLAEFTYAVTLSSNTETITGSFLTPPPSLTLPTDVPTVIAGTRYNFSDPSLGGFVQTTAQPVPEPGSLALLGTGLLTLGLIARRKKA